MPDGRLLEIVKGGVFKGTVTVDSADIAGSFEGELKVKKRLFIRASGRVTGTVRYGQFEVERGGRIEGESPVRSGGPRSRPSAGGNAACP